MQGTIVKFDNSLFLHRLKEQSDDKATSELEMKKATVLDVVTVQGLLVLVSPSGCEAFVPGLALN